MVIQIYNKFGSFLILYTIIYHSKCRMNLFSCPCVNKLFEFTQFPWLSFFEVPWYYIILKVACYSYLISLRRKVLQLRGKHMDYNHHNFLLDNLLIWRNTLIHNVYKSAKLAKETNWKQIFLKPQNANICLTSIKTLNIGYFHFLSFCYGLSNAEFGVNEP